LFSLVNNEIFYLRPFYPPAFCRGRETQQAASGWKMSIYHPNRQDLRMGLVRDCGKVVISTDCIHAMDEQRITDLKDRERKLPVQLGSRLHFIENGVENLPRREKAVAGILRRRSRWRTDGNASHLADADVLLTWGAERASQKIDAGPLLVSGV